MWGFFTLGTIDMALGRYTLSLGYYLEPQSLFGSPERDPASRLLLHLVLAVSGRAPWVDWVAVKELRLIYHDEETILFLIYPYCGNFI